MYKYALFSTVLYSYLQYLYTQSNAAPYLTVPYLTCAVCVCIRFLMLNNRVSGDDKLRSYNRDSSQSGPKLISAETPRVGHLAPDIK